MVRIAYEKIIKFNPSRYYILSYIGISKKDEKEIKRLTIEIKENHGCQLIINGILYTLRYYLRLILSPKIFFNSYVELVENDNELKLIHKQKLKKLIKKSKL